MEKVKRQTVNELLALTAENHQLAIGIIDKSYGVKTNREVEALKRQKAEQEVETINKLEEQCHGSLDFVDISNLASIVCYNRREIPNRLEAFCKILALLGVEVQE